jgi:hypothetical protein
MVVWVGSLLGTVVIFVDQDMPSKLESSVNVGCYIYPSLTFIRPVTWWDQWARAKDQYAVPMPAETGLRMSQRMISTRGFSNPVESRRQDEGRAYAYVEQIYISTDGSSKDTPQNTIHPLLLHPFASISNFPLPIFRRCSLFLLSFFPFPSFFLRSSIILLPTIILLHVRCRPFCFLSCLSLVQYPCQFDVSEVFSLFRSGLGDFVSESRLVCLSLVCYLSASLPF